MKYTDYKDIDKEQLQKDIDDIKSKVGPVTWEDFDFLMKMQKWGRISLTTGILLLLVIVFNDFNIFINLIIGSLSGILIGVYNVNRWANITHPILHGAFDKLKGIPKKYTSKGFAKGKIRRFIDWRDWIVPEAWAYEHNIMHHYHLGELDDPDNVEKNMVWLHKAKIPMFFKYLFVYVFATIWKLTYYAPNTLRILNNKDRKKQGLEETTKYELNPFSKNGSILWKDYILPYFIFQFIILPLLFFPLGINAVLTVLFILVVAEIYANLHSFLVIVPNHSAEDIYQFETPHKTQGEYYLRQIMGSVNYNTGTDFKDFLHGFLNYQIEHHIFPNMPNSFLQKAQPIIKDICKKHNLEYRQESVFKRMKMTIDLMVGKTKVLRVEGI